MYTPVHQQLELRAPILPMSKAEYAAKSELEKAALKEKFEVPPHAEMVWISPAPTKVTPAALLALWLEFFDHGDNPPAVMPEERLQTLPWWCLLADKWSIFLSHKTLCPTIVQSIGICFIALLDFWNHCSFPNAPFILCITPLSRLW